MVFVTKRTAGCKNSIVQVNARGTYKFLKTSRIMMDDSMAEYGSELWSLGADNYLGYGHLAKS